MMCQDRGRRGKEESGQKSAKKAVHSGHFILFSHIVYHLVQTYIQYCTNIEILYCKLA